MTEESKLELFDRWTETKDKAEFVRLGLILFPESTREELESHFEAAMSGYREALSTAEARRK